MFLCKATWWIAKLLKLASSMSLFGKMRIMVEYSGLTTSVTNVGPKPYQCVEVKSDT
jgi:hypothetical protein